MSHPDVSLPVTVGVADKQHAALAFAAEEARLSSCDVRVVHAYTVPPSPPRGLGAAYGIDVEGTFRESGRRVLVDAAAFLASNYGDLAVEPILERGPASQALTRLSKTSRLVVLGPDDSAPWYSRLFQGRVSRKLAEVAGCPVVVVPDTWNARSAIRGVTLLVDSQSVAHGPLRFAFEEASRRRDVLHILHVHPQDGSHDESVSRHETNRLIRSLGAAYPSVWVDTKVVHGTVDLATVESFERTGLLVLGQPQERHVLAILHRSLPRAVIERADCPVAVVAADYDV